MGTITGVTVLLQMAAILLLAVSDSGVDAVLREQATAIAQQAVAQATTLIGANATPGAVATATTTVPKVAAVDVYDVVVMTGATTTQIRWHTTGPVMSKVILLDGKGVAREKGSQLGMGTFHVVDIDGLTENSTYTFSIEGDMGADVGKKMGSAKTER